jgi:hypothetical protein
MSIFKNRRLRVNATQVERRPIEGIEVELDVSPPWWPYIHHRSKGAFGVAIHVLMRSLEKFDVEPIAVHAETDRLTVVFAPQRLHESFVKYEQIQGYLRDMLVTGMTIEDSDYASDARPAYLAPVTRADLEHQLAELGFKQAEPTLDPLERVQHVWTFGQNVAIQFDSEPSALTATWTDRSGDAVLSFAQILKMLTNVTRDKVFIPVNLEEEEGILSRDGDPHGGVFSAQGD